MMEVLSHELQGDTLPLHMGALFFSGFPQFHIPICHLTLGLTEKTLRPLLTSSQPLKTSSSDHQNFMFGLLQNQSEFPVLLFGCDVDLKNSAAWEWLDLHGLNSVPCQSHFGA